jgi:hypothetical protein
MLEFSRGANRNVDTWDQNIFQGTTPSCAVRCQQIIMRDYGIQIPQEDLMDYAAQKGWYNPEDGTMTKDIGNLLETCRIGTHVSFDTTVYDLVKELESGHRVIVSVDADELWAEPGSDEWKFFQQMKSPNHAVVVAGARIDPIHPENSTVILTDPGRGDAFIEYKMEHFVHAWQDSNFYMMATDKPAPYQYNELTGSMEFSNFATDYTVSEFPFHNKFSDIYQLDFEEYHPYYNDGHLFNVAEGLSHEDFLAHWENDDFESLDTLFELEEMPDSYVQIGDRAYADDFVPFDHSGFEVENSSPGCEDF